MKQYVLFVLIFIVAKGEEVQHVELRESMTLSFSMAMACIHDDECSATYIVGNGRNRDVTKLAFEINGMLDIHGIKPETKFFLARSITDNKTLAAFAADVATACGSFSVCSDELSSAYYVTAVVISLVVVSITYVVLFFSGSVERAHRKAMASEVHSGKR